MSKHTATRVLYIPPHVKQMVANQAMGNVRNRLSAVLAGSWPGQPSVGLTETACLIRNMLLKFFTQLAPLCRVGYSSMPIFVVQQ